MVERVSEVRWSIAGTRRGDVTIGMCFALLAASVSFYTAKNAFFFINVMHVLVYKLTCGCLFYLFVHVSAAVK